MGRAHVSKDPGSVVVALRKVFLRSLYPVQVTTDMGQEFLGKPVASYLQEAGIVHATKDPNFFGVGEPRELKIFQPTSLEISKTIPKAQRH